MDQYILHLALWNVLQVLPRWLRGSETKGGWEPEGEVEGGRKGEGERIGEKKDCLSLVIFAR